jgi:hypothetical protein
MTGDDPMRLPRVTVLLPTRRAVRAPRAAFLRAAPEGREAGTPLLLPRAADRRSQFGRTDFGRWDSGRRNLGGAARHPRAEAPPDADQLEVKRGIATPKRELDLIRERLKWAERLHTGKAEGV